MASLTPLSKGLIGLIVIGAMASAVWHLALKDRLHPAESTATDSTMAGSPVDPTANALRPPADPPPTAVKSEPPAPTTARSGPDSAKAAKPSPAENAETGRKLLAQGNFAAARPYLERAVQGGEASAACHLGEMTLKGQGGITANQEAAARLFQVAQAANIICFASGS